MPRGGSATGEGVPLTPVTTDRDTPPMPLVILAALFVAPALAYFGLIPLALVVVAEIGVLLAAAWWFDRGRAIGARDPFLDENRPDFAMPMATMDPPRPTEAIEHPKDRPGAL
jgi:hypothetical protein